LREAGRRSTIDIGNLKNTLKSMSPGPGARRSSTLEAARAATKEQNRGASKRASTLGGMMEQNVEEAPDVEEDEEAARPPPMTKVASVTENAPMLASKYRLELLETKIVLIEFAKAKKNARGGLDFPEFAKLCCNVFDIQNANEEVVMKIYKDTNMENNSSVENFLEWYMLNMFAVTAILTASPEKAKSEKLIAHIASEFGVSGNAIDNIKREFDKYDIDSSGLIDKDEFSKMLKTLLKAKDTCDLSEDRIRKFWMEIDHDGSGSVDFSEFAQWYLKYFDPNLTDAAGSCNLIEAFYASFNPDHQRRRGSINITPLP